jgi:transcriptional regulator of acetoin/glycerol metabolism
MTFAQCIQKAAADYLRNCLAQTGYNYARAAQIAGIRRTSFYRLMTRYGAPGVTPVYPRCRSGELA